MFGATTFRFRHVYLHWKPDQSVPSVQGVESSNGETEILSTSFNILPNLRGSVIPVGLEFLRSAEVHENDGPGFLGQPSIYACPAAISYVTR